VRVLGLLLLLLPLTACGGARPDRPAVVATTTQLADVVRTLGGGAVSVHQILRPNTDPHEYEPRPADVAATAGAKLVVASGDGLDHWIGEIVDEAGGGPRVLTVAPAHIPFRRAGDPHWWHDPRNMAAAVPVIRDALERVAPRSAAAIRRRAAAYVRRVRALDAGIAACVREVPVRERALVTSHDAFGYFARRYGIRVVGAVIPAQTSEAQPSAGQISRLAGVVRAEHVRAIFPESSLNPKLAQALGRETGARASLSLYGDTLGPEGSSGDTYLKMELANARAMVEGFTGGARTCRISRL
jgi:zinc/manganese transport system substrate-binding protein